MRRDTPRLYNTDNINILINMKTSFFKQGILAMGIACCMQLSAVENPVDYVNTLVGTQSKYELSTGNTYPATAMENNEI